MIMFAVCDLCGGVLLWLSVWSKVQTCIWPSWCRCHSLSLASVKSRLVLPFWYRLTLVDPEKGPLNVCVCVFVMCVQQCQHSCDELRSRRRRCAVGHGGPPGRLLDVAATTLRLPGPRRPVAAQGGQVLAQDDVPLDARVSDAGGRRRVAGSNSRQHTVGIVDGCCHAGEETEKYVDALDILSSFICTGTADVSYDSCACYVLNFHFLKSLFLVFLFYALVLYCCTASLKITV